MSRPQLTFFVELPSEALPGLLQRPDVLRFLTDGGHRISIGMLDLDAGRAEAIRQLEHAGVAVTAWLLLDRQDGYWLNADNYALALTRYRDLHVWAGREGLKLERLGLDIEPPRDHLDALMAKPFEGVLERLTARRSTDEVHAAEAAYRALCQEVRRDGRHVESYQFPFIVDERRSGTSLLRRALGIVDVPVDTEVLMLYRSYLGPEGAHAYFRDANAIALGVTGGGVHADNDALEPKIGWDELHADLLCASRHTEQLYVFSLEGCVAQDMLGRLERIDWQAEPPLPSDASLERARRGRRFMQMAAKGEPILDRLFPAKRPETPPANSTPG